MVLLGYVLGLSVHLYYEFSDTAVNVLSGMSLETGQRKVQDKLQGIMFTAWKFMTLLISLRMAKKEIIREQ